MSQPDDQITEYKDGWDHLLAFVMGSYGLPRNFLVPEEEVTPDHVLEVPESGD